MIVTVETPRRAALPASRSRQRTDSEPARAPVRKPRARATPVPTCIFCDRPSGRADYAWPEWLCHFLTDHLARSGRDLRGDAPSLERMRAEVEQTVDCVCDACRDGWMRRLDESVSPFLGAMMLGEPTALPQVRRRFLARWSAKTAIVMEHAGDAAVRTPRFACEYLRRIGVHPGTQVLVGKYDGDGQVLTHERDLFSRTIDGKKHYLSQTSMVVGKLLIQVFADPWRSSPPELADDGTQPLFALVPSHGRRVDWPPPVTVDDSLYDLVRHGALDDSPQPPGATPGLTAPNDPAA